jgi:hypothetical protein
LVPRGEPDEVLGQQLGHRRTWDRTLSAELRVAQPPLLRWQDADMKSGEVHVRHSLEELDGKLRLKEPKTKAGKRVVVLPAVACEALAEHRKRTLAEGHHGPDRPVFPDTEGGSGSRTSIARSTP